MKSPLVTLANLPSSHYEIIIWWYGPVVMNSQSKENPKILVFYREILEDEQYGKIKHFLLSISQLTALQIGSVWKDKKLVRYSHHKKKKYTLDVSVSSFEVSSLNRDSTLFKPSYYELFHPKDKNELLIFSTSKGKLIVPCLEFFVSMYGRSAEVKRALLANPWNTLISEVFKETSPAINGDWQVHIDGKLSKGDAVFLAHLWNDPVTQRASRSLNNQLSAAAATASVSYSDKCFLKVTPWFHGHMELEVSGIQLPNNDFLGLSITGHSEPTGKQIVICNLTSTSMVSPPTNNAGGATATTLRSGTKKVQDGSVIDDENEPDRGLSPTGVECRSIKLLGERRSVVAGSRKANRLKPSAFTLSPYHPNLSTNNPRGKGKGIGSAQLTTPAVLTPQDSLLSIWNAFVSLKRKIPSRLTDLFWWTENNGFGQSANPKLSSFKKPIPSDSTKVTPSIAKWPFLDDLCTQCRGLLCIKIRLDGKIFFILEIQRKEISSVGDRLDSFRGCIFESQNAIDSINFIKELLSELPLHRGVFENSIRRLNPTSIRYALYKHINSSLNTHPMEKTIRNALQKVYVDI